MDIAPLLRQHLESVKFLQLATVRDGKPWIVTVHFAFDDELNLYWLSTAERRHSKDIADNPHVAVALAVKTDMPVIGIQAGGRAEQLKFTEHPLVYKKVMQQYVQRHGTGKDFYKRAAQGIAKHKLYKLTPEKYVLFDELNFSKQPPQEWKLDFKQ